MYRKYLYILYIYSYYKSKGILRYTTHHMQFCRKDEEDSLFILRAWLLKKYLGNIQARLGTNSFRAGTLEDRVKNSRGNNGVRKELLVLVYVSLGSVPEHLRGKEQGVQAKRKSLRE